MGAPHGLGRTGLPTLLVIGLALLVRLVVLLEGRDAPTFAVPVVDARVYDLAARSLAGGLGLDYRFFWQPFFYPAYLGVVYTLTGGSILAAKLVQLLLGVATCGLTLRLGRRLGGRRVGLVAGVICALHGPMIFFETELVATGWACFWAVFLLDRLSLAHPGEPRRDWLLTGVIAALAVLTRPSFLPALLLAVAMTLRGAAAREWAPRMALAGLGFALVVSPVALLGGRVADHPSFLPASGPMNLYLGNHREPCEMLTIRPGEAWTELARQARPSTAGDLRANRDHFRRLLSEELTGHPGPVGAGLVRKAAQVLSSRELPRNVDPYFQREFSPVLSVLMFRVGGFGFPAGVLLPLAVWGAWTGRRRIPGSLYVFTAVYLLAIVAVFVSARYRVPMVPALAILAAFGIEGLIGAVRARRLRTLAAAGLAMAAMVALAVLPGPFCEEEVDYRAETQYAVGYARHGAGELEAAAEAYTEALRRRPDYAELLNQFALLRLQQGRELEAIALWSRAVNAEPANRAVRLNLGRAHALEHRYDDALVQYRAAIDLDPDDAEALLGGGVALLGIARFDEGVDWLEHALGLRADFADQVEPMAEALAQRGRVDLADRLRPRVPR